MNTSLRRFNDIYHPTAGVIGAVFLAGALLTGMPPWAAAQDGFGGALSFNGPGLVRIPGLGTVIPTNEITVEAWVRTVSVQDDWPVIFCLEPDQTTNRFVAHVASRYIYDIYWHFGDISGSAGRCECHWHPASLGTWEHFAFVASQSGNFMKVYTNGVQLHSVSNFNDMARGNYSLVLGLFFVGELDDFRIWNKARTASEIQADLMHPISGTESNLVVYWKFDEAGGIKAYDAGPSHLSGTLTNRPMRVPSLWSPKVTLNGANPLTNECHAAFEDPGAWVSAPPVGMAAGYRHSLAVRADGLGLAWGKNAQGESTVPVSATNVVAVSGGENHSLALRRDGSVVGWGSYATSPASATNVIAISSGYYHNLALRSNGTVIAWGSNSSGQTNVPASATNVVAVAGGGNHSLALRGNGTVVGWGNNTYGQVTIPSPATNVVMIAAGNLHSLALKADGSVVAWGAGGAGQSGDPHYGQCVIPAGATNIVAISGGGWHSVALRADGTVLAWGWDGYGQTNTPAAVTNVAAIAAGGAFNLAMRADGTLFSWGNNDWGQCTIPASVSNLDLAITVSGSVDTNTPGSQLLTYSSTNAFGISGTATRLVVVADTLPPVLTLLGDNPVQIEAGGPYIDAGATATDFCSGDLTPAIVTNNTVNPAVPGLYTNTYAVTDGSGNTGTAHRVIRVVDAPLVSTLTPTAIGPESATGRGQVNPNGLPTEIWFEWGATTNYGEVTPATPAGDGFAGATHTGTFSGLTAGQTCHYRAVGSNELGVVYGSDMIITAGQQVVSSLGDQGAGTLRQALADASAGCTITLCVTGTVALTSGPLILSNNLTLIGPGASNLVISGNNASRVFYINAGVTAACSGLTISGGRVSNGGTGQAGMDGGGIYNLGVLTLDACTVAGNSAGAGGNGANGASPGSSGGAGGAGGRGGGIFNAVGAVLNLNRCAIHQNSAGAGGLGGYGANGTGGWLGVDGGNGGHGGGGGAGGGGAGILNDGALTATNCTVGANLNGQGGQGGHGGNGGAAGSWSSSYAGNGGNGGNGGAGGSGGGILNTGSGTLIAVNCTVAGNTAGGGGSYGLRGYGGTGQGGADGANGTSGSAGMGGGVRTDGVAAEMLNTIVAGNSTDVSGAFSTLGHNLIGRNDGSTGFTNAMQGDLVGTGAEPVNAQLGTLAYNGGPTRTCALLAGSVAINGGDSVAGATSDQRGRTRCSPFDMGAYEYQMPALILHGRNPIYHPLGDPFTDPGAAATNSCGDSLTGDIVVTGSVDWGTAGNYELAYTILDPFSGDVASASRMVLVGFPLVTTLPASGVTNGDAVLNGTVNPSGGTGDTWFEWRKATSLLIERTPPEPYGSGTTNISFQSALSGLIPGITYQYRIVASNSVWQAHGGYQTFWAPLVRLNGEAVVTNECHTAFADPGATAGMLSAVAVSAGGYHNLALRPDSTVVAWGLNNFGQINIPASATNIAAVAGGSTHSLALRADGSLIAWGANHYGQLNTPAGATNIVAIAAGYGQNLALRGDGTVLGWGQNDYLQSVVPGNASPAVAIAAGGYHNLALRTDGTVVGWGNNNSGQTTIPSGLSNVVSIAAGHGHSVALLTNGSVVAWGDNTYGGINVPSNATNLARVVAYGWNTLGLRADGTLVAWGRNDTGQTNLPAGLTNVVDAAPGILHAIALKADGALVAWGTNNNGQTSIPDLNLSPPLAVFVSDFPDTNAPGQYTMRYTSTNTAGGVGMATREVWVVDTQAPTLSLIGAAVMTHVAHTPFLDPGATATDDCAGELNASIIVTGSVDIETAGVNTLTYTVTDASGNLSITNRMILVIDAPSVAATGFRITATNTHTGTRTIELQANVNPNGLDSTAYFEHGLTTAYPGRSEPASLPAAYAGTNLTFSIDSIIPGVFHHWRIVASNSLGVTCSPDQVIAVPAIFTPGDANGDGVVDEDELDAVLAGYWPGSPWLSLTNAAGLGGTNVTFALTGSTAGAFSVLMSTNLVDWEYLGPATPVYQFFDTNAPVTPLRYYRLRWP